MCQSVIIVEALCKIWAADVATMAASYTEHDGEREGFHCGCGKLVYNDDEK